MARRKIPDNDLTLKQQQRRARNERYRLKKNETGPHQVLHLVKETQTPSVSKTQKASQTNTQKTIETLTLKTRLETTLPASLPEKHPARLTSAPALETLKKQEPTLPLFVYLRQDLFALVLIAMICAVSFILVTFQIRAYSQIPEFEGLEAITALSIECLLIILSALSARGSIGQRLGSAFLFVALTTTTVYLLHRDSKSNAIGQTEQVRSDENQEINDSERVRSLKDTIERYTAKIAALTPQLDPNKKNTYAAKGENGNLRITKQEIAETEAKIEALGMELQQVQNSGSTKTTSSQKIELIDHDSYFNLVLRVLLLLSSAFLVHTVLRRFDSPRREVA